MTRRAQVMWLDEATSTNTVLADMPDAPDCLVVAAHSQTAGRGQRGNSWEAEPGKNLTFSMLLRPSTIAPARQFRISQLVSLVVVDELRRVMPDHAEEVKVKWPNDIYCGDKKICGILIEHTLTSNKIDRTIAGIGVNINQKRFISDAPNPVSVAMITGREYHLDEVLTRIADGIASLLDNLETDPDNENKLHERYMASLWRRPGFYTYHDRATDTQFEGAIIDVAPTGHLTIRPADGSPDRIYAFKEVEFVL